MIKLTIDGMCLISTIMNKIGIDESYISDMFNVGKDTIDMSKAEKEILQTSLGAKLIMRIVSNLTTVREELIKLLAVSKEITEEEAAKEDIIAFIKEMVGNDGFMGFFKSKLTPA